jgi:cyclin L
LDRVRPDFAAVAKYDGTPENIDWNLSEGELEIARNRLYSVEALVLRSLGFQTHVALPYSLCVNYLQTLDVSSSTSGPIVAKRAFAYLNTALLSPQLLYLTHQPSAIATAAIYLAARETGVSLPQTSWWEVFDVDREDLGFIVLALKSVETFAAEEQRKWSSRKVPLTVEELQAEMERRSMLENGE